MGVWELDGRSAFCRRKPGIYYNDSFPIILYSYKTMFENSVQLKEQVFYPEICFFFLSTTHFLTPSPSNARLQLLICPRSWWQLLFLPACSWWSPSEDREDKGHLRRRPYQPHPNSAIRSNWGSQHSSCKSIRGDRWRDSLETWTGLVPIRGHWWRQQLLSGRISLQTAGKEQNAGSRP